MDFKFQFFAKKGLPFRKKYIIGDFKDHRSFIFPKTKNTLVATSVERIWHQIMCFENKYKWFDSPVAKYNKQHSKIKMESCYFLSPFKDFLARINLNICMYKNEETINTYANQDKCIYYCKMMVLSLFLPFEPFH